MAKLKLVVSVATAALKSKLALASGGIALTGYVYSSQLSGVGIYTTGGVLKEVYPDLKLGEVSKGSDSMLYVPGSITIAVHTGQEFVKRLGEMVGITPSIINSQMDLIDYPGQALGLEAAKARNELVARGISKFISDSSESEITIIAHSAGTKSALVAAQQYYKANPKSRKRVNIVLLGAGSPEGGLEEDITIVTKDSRVTVTEFRTRFDPVPAIGGPKVSHLTIEVDSPKSPEIKAAIGETGVWEAGIDDVEEHRRRGRDMVILTSLLDEHDSERYLESVAKHLSKGVLLRKKATELATSIRGSGSKLLETSSVVSKAKPQLLM